jgi:hypothetical protein
MPGKDNAFNRLVQQLRKTSIVCAKPGRPKPAPTEGAHSAGALKNFLPLYR